MNIGLSGHPVQNMGFLCVTGSIKKEAVLDLCSSTKTLFSRIVSFLPDELILVIKKSPIPFIIMSGVYSPFTGSKPFPYISV